MIERRYINPSDDVSIGIAACSVTELGTELIGTYTIIMTLIGK